MSKPITKGISILLKRITDNEKDIHHNYYMLFDGYGNGTDSRH